MAFAAGAAAAPSATTTPLRVVLDRDYPPYSFQSADGRLQGILIDEWRRWEEKTGRTVELHALDWADALARMRAGDFDVIGSIVETAARREYFDFTSPIASIDVPIFFRAGLSGIVDLESLRALPVAVKNGDQRIDLLRARGLTKLVSFPNHASIVDAAKEHRIDVFIFDAPSAHYHLHRAGIESDFRQSAPIFREELRRGVRKGEAATLRAVVDGFAAITPEELSQIEEKWYGRTVNHARRYLVYGGWAGAIGLMLVAGLVGWNRTLRHKIEQRTAALREAEDRVRRFINTIPTSAWSVTPDGSVDFVNQGWLDYTGRSLKEELADPRGPMHPDDVPAVLDKWRTAMATSTAFEGEMRMRRADGIYRWFLVRTVPQLDEQGRIVKWFGASIDIEDRKQAEQTLQAGKQQLRALVERLHRAREEEAKRIARELHDDLGQQLTALNLQLENLEIKLADAAPAQRAQIAGMRTIVNGMVGAVQNMAGGLRLSQLDVLGLTAAIDWQLQEFSRRSGIPCAVARLDEITELSDAQNTAVFRILQEALTNIVRHARATRVDVSLESGAGRVVLNVRDNGRGITAAELADRKAIGLLGMHERAEIVGGTVTITGTPGVGTTVVVTIPIEPAGART